MRTESPIPGCFAVVLIGSLLAIAHLCHGQEPASDALLLARTCVSERGWRVDANDCAAIFEVATARMRRHGGSLSDNLRALSPRLHGLEPLARRAWLRDLDRDAHTPRGWARARWTRREGCGANRDGRCRVAREDDWLATLAEADRLVLNGDGGRVCIGTPSAWGSTDDLARHLRAHPEHRWREIDCGETVNRFGTWETRR